MAVKLTNKHSAFEQCKQIARLNGWALRLEWNWSEVGCYASFVFRAAQDKELIIAYGANEGEVFKQLLENYSHAMKAFIQRIKSTTDEEIIGRIP